MVKKEIKNRKSNFYRRGVTIVELLVVLVIMTLLTTLILTRFRVGQSMYTLSQAAHGFAFDLRQAQAMAVGGVVTKDATEPKCDQGPAGDECPLGGYGIETFFQGGKYGYELFLFTKKQIDFCMDTGGGTRVSVKKVYLPSGISVDNTNMAVFFAPPLPRTCINGNPAIAAITFTLTQGANTRTVNVEKYGKIDVQ